MLRNVRSHVTHVKARFTDLQIHESSPLSSIHRPSVCCPTNHTPVHRIPDPQVSNLSPHPYKSHQTLTDIRFHVTQVEARFADLQAPENPTADTQKAVQTYQTTCAAETLGAPASMLCVSPDGVWAAIASSAAIHVYDMATLKHHGQLPPVSDVGFPARSRCWMHLVSIVILSSPFKFTCQPTSAARIYR
jgi:hypothetical protein